MSAAVEFFVVVAGQPNVADSEIVLARAGSARQAHEGAADMFRRKRGLAASVHVRTATAYRSDSEADATLFTIRLIAEADAQS